MTAIRLPQPDQHIALAGRTGSGKTVAGLEMLSLRDLEKQPAFIIDHKSDDHIAKLPAEPFNPSSLFLPTRGLHHIKAKLNGAGRDTLETFMERAFKRGNAIIYVDEGHLLGPSDAVRMIMVAGRSKHVSMMWTSQKASWIDPFIWSQAHFYRVFQLQTKLDTKRFEENFPVRWISPPEFFSYYYDVSKNKLHYLSPAGPIERTIERLDTKLRTLYRAI